MYEFTLKAEVWLPRPPEEVFPFFAEARNLETITPPWLKFEVLTPAPIVMRAGSLIDYRIRVHGVPLGWRTKIAEWDPPHRFVDIQLRGPYLRWHHTHGFAARDGGTLCTDDVRYWPRGGALMNYLFVRRDIEAIFLYRKKRMIELFPAQVVEQPRPAGSAP
jgi:ligand-binding SRPBCC domain-containing protein